jgi:hypothetical protein
MHVLQYTPRALNLRITIGCTRLGCEPLTKQKTAKLTVSQLIWVWLLIHQRSLCPILSSPRRFGGGPSSERTPLHTSNYPDQLPAQNSSLVVRSLHYLTLPSRFRHCSPSILLRDTWPLSRSIVSLKSAVFLPGGSACTPTRALCFSRQTSPEPLPPLIKLNLTPRSSLLAA